MILLHFSAYYKNGGGSSSANPDVGGSDEKHLKSKKGQRQQQQQQQQHHPFFLSGPSNAIAIRIKELDECCCADVPCISIVKEYCESSSLHGLRYITEDGRHWTERVLWVLLCLCGFVLTVYFIYPIWAKWNEKAGDSFF